MKKNTLALQLALQLFEVYVGSSSLPVTVYIDPSSLVLHEMYNQNQQVMQWALLIQHYMLEIKYKKDVDYFVNDVHLILNL